MTDEHDSRHDASRRKFLQAAGAGSALLLTESAVAETEGSDGSLTPDEIGHDVSVRNTLDEAVAVSLTFTQRKTHDGTAADAFHRQSFSLSAHGIAGERVTDTLNLDGGVYEVEATVRPSSAGGTATKIWGLPPGGVADYQTLVVRVRPDGVPTLRRVEA
jgi:hypothetical protein